MTIADVTERELIARIRRQLPPSPAWMTVGIGDDAAVVEPERNRLEVLSVDALVEGVHFDRAFVPPEAIGHRALAANLSDLAAMGADPRLALLSFVLPPSLPLADFDGIVAGLTRLAAKYRVHVAGGNLTRSPGPLMLDLTLVGTVKPRRALPRRGARPGDELFVTGTIGSAAAGLQMLAARAADGRPLPDGSAACIERYLYPDPRLRMGILVGRNRAARACMDLSDGLADAVSQVTDASHVGAIIDAALLPVDPAAARWFADGGADPADAAVAGGDDYELLLAVAPRSRGRLAAATRHGGAPLTRIGVCTADAAVVIRRGGQLHPLPQPGFRHFR